MSDSKTLKTRKIFKTRYVDINLNEGNFFSRLIGTGKESYDLSDISLLRQVFSKEKAKILHVIKVHAPNSIYALAKFLKRDLKSVRQDLKILEKFGFIDYQKESQGNRESLKPILPSGSIEIIVNI
jgi:hypothetical protein